MTTYSSLKTWMTEIVFAVVLTLVGVETVVSILLILMWK